MSKTRQFLTSPGIFRLFLAVAVVMGHITRIETGRWAVNVFFVLSGYWVTKMYENKYQKLDRSLLAFYLSRYLRLLPVFLFCQMLALLYYFCIPDPLIHPLAITPLWLLRAFLILGNGSQPLIIGPAWSLDVEVQFYLLFPAIFYGVSRLPKQKRAWVALAIGFMMLPFSWNPMGATTPFLPQNLAFFLFGLAGAYMKEAPTPSFAYGSWAFFCSISILVIALHSTRPLVLNSASPSHLQNYKVMYSSIMATCILPYTYYSVTIKSSILDKHLGNLSYPLYLFHWLPLLCFRYYYGLISLKSQPILFSLEMLAILIGSLVIYFAIDRPADTLRARFIARKFSKPSV